MLVADASVRLLAIYWLCWAITSALVPSRLSSGGVSGSWVCGADSWVGLLCSDAFWSPPLVLMGFSPSCLSSVRAKGSAVSLRGMLRITHRTCENLGSRAPPPGFQIQSIWDKTWRMSIPELPGDANTAGSGTTVWKPLFKVEMQKGSDKGSRKSGID